MTEQTKDQLWEQRTEWPLAMVAIAFLAMYSIEVLYQPQGLEATFLGVATWVAWSLFVFDYIARLCLAPHRGRWFIRHIIDLLIVALPMMRPLRLLRLLVLVGALQKAVGNAVRGRIMLYTISGVSLLIYVTSLAILNQERGHPGATITSFGKAVWWAITTVTTVGYGDLYPITVTGRVIAVLLMIGGISLIGVVTASLASWIVQRVAETDSANRAATVAQIDGLRTEVRRLAALLREQHSDRVN
ncbi:potassium channel family protein [Mycobacterium ulcerans]|uniref:Conserved ion transport protein n=1 Tax=Mycobacterium ulcerans (strain Agy99) TaxID=362242 RepID=A0PNB7_MYCUA|nr:potassium channel family protein [Mycobacterium ulcerans]ABL03836.1 conserved ion transport protein [Mycobacterium ulcerans Agy99]MEB3907080.1 potassium channel family protein [Mycobacterium ulcerans]MEB3911216.1 potassium channel family protein [Mycobacterium ulcerans]MEB3921459.1 potassium channel family protein [Mycobacterium ulcerans]MEB3925582.1 potassium channel family protein [Mycobacterium ulcerans]